jgi:hypothetical protein
MDDTERTKYEPYVRCKEEEVRVDQNSGGTYLKVLNTKHWKMFVGERPKQGCTASKMKQMSFCSVTDNSIYCKK